MNQKQPGQINQDNDPENDDFKKGKEEAFKKIQEILKQHDGLEANIPLTSEYWGLLNRYRLK